MTYDECVNKAEDAVNMGVIEFEQIDAYAKHLYETHKNDEEMRFRQPWHNRP